MGTTNSSFNNPIIKEGKIILTRKEKGQTKIQKKNGRYNDSHKKKINRNPQYGFNDLKRK